ncbi:MULTISPECIES: lysoplasmalogenase family protein [Streptomyces]|uniref:lysoplasmalogenase family protein n=1 Tax=Streptomyces TaxID=1883 RepID=UPI0029BF990E|nr:lysoplasmalogenase family protein [Streptomyces sp. WI03-4A]MDX2595538.1 lysoplasmalogenase family protein [Streptomyces sp. WI03-4A]
MPRLILAFAALAALDIAGVAAGLPALEWVAKPLLAPVLAVHLWRLTGTRHARVLAGLGLAAAGDVALMLPGRAAFAVGLGFFLGAQLCWTAAFVRAGALRHLRSRRLLCAVHGVGWAAAVAVLAPALGLFLGVAVAGYALALVTMALTARVRGPRAAWGGLVFLGSDLLVGLGAAGIDFPGQGVLVMVTYTLALALITTAVAAAEPGPADGAAPVPSALELRT